MNRVLQFLDLGSVSPDKGASLMLKRFTDSKIALYIADNQWWLRKGLQRAGRMFCAILGGILNLR